MKNKWGGWHESRRKNMAMIRKQRTPDLKKRVKKLNLLRWKRNISIARLMQETELNYNTVWRCLHMEIEYMTPRCVSDLEVAMERIIETLDNNIK